MRRILAAVATLFILASISGWAGYVVKQETPLRVGPAPEAAILFTLKQGETVA
ncbi:MAG: hypothetical protein HQL53_13860, partial [Magnetococcales bacterium]|nr:hypothetical protein [Magnetococcales bacterium]